MKQLSIILLFLISNLHLAQECKTPVTIISPIKDGLIFVDDEFIGSDSVEVSLEKGKHSLLIKENLRKWNALKFRDTIFAADCSPLVFSYGKNNLFEADYQDESHFVESESNLLLAYQSLKNISSVDRTFDETKPVKLNFDTGRQEKRFIETTTFKILIGSAVALGAVSAYFKIKADNNYEEYQQTLNNSYLDKTDKYDLYSGIAFGALQINFGALLYHFLKDRR